MDDTRSTNLKAQFGEDRLLAEHFGHKQEGFYVEIGAYDGVEMSNTYYFERLGWRGILVEADPELAEQCRQARPKSAVVNCAVVGPDALPVVSFEISEECRGLSALNLDDDHLARIQHYTGRQQIRRITVSAMTLDQILQAHNPQAIDFLTIDVEGFEWEVLRGFTISRWHPHLVIIERNTTLPESRIMRYLHKHDYLYYRTTGVNDWFLSAASGAAAAPVYRLKLFGSYYLPKYLSVLRAALRQALIRLGLYRWLRPLWRGRAS